MTDAKTFYTSLLMEALNEMPQECSMVIGPIFAGDKDLNLEKFNQRIKELREKGEVIFSQLDYLDDEVENAPHEYKIKFPIFYKGLLYSGRVKKVYVLNGWEESEGTKREIGYAQDKDLEIIYL